MPFGPGLLISGSFLAGYGYWRYTFRQVTRALRLERAGMLNEARVLLTSFLTSRNPLTRRGESRHRCRLLLARLERKAGRYADAVAAVDTLLAEQSSPGIAVAAMQIRADALAWSGSLDEALHGASEALTAAAAAGLKTFGLEIEGLICRILIWRGEFKEARERAGNLIHSGGPTAAYAHLRMSEAARAAGEFEEAAGWARKLLELSETTAEKAPAAADRFDPGRAGAGVWRALAYVYGARAAWLAEDPDLARDWLTTGNEMSRLPASDAAAWWGLNALEAQAAGDMARKADYTDRMRAADDAAPGGYGAHAWRRYFEARLLMAEGRYREAADEIAAALRENPPGDSLPEYLFNLGLCRELGGCPGADAAYEEGSAFPDPFYFSELCRARSGGGTNEVRNE